MKEYIVASAVALVLGSASGLPSAKGCPKDAAVGAVGGHLAGHHGVIGAAAGCAVGSHMANKKAKSQAATPVQPTTQPAQAGPAQTLTTKTVEAARPPRIGLRHDDDGLALPSSLK